MSNRLTKLSVMAVVFIMVSSMVFSGAVLAGSPDDPETLSDGDIVWQGQNVEYTDQEHSEDVWRIYEDGDFVRQVTADEDGTVVIESDRLNTGSHSLEDPDNTEVASFLVVEQTVSVGDDVTVQNDGDNTDTTFEFDSNRAAGDYIITADELPTNDDDATDLGDIFEGGEYMEWEEDGDTVEHYVLTGVSDSATIDADFTDAQVGTHDIEFESFDADASDTVTVTVEDVGEGTAEFNERVTETVTGDSAEIVVNMDNTTTATIDLGGEDVSYEASAEVVDGDESGDVVVHFDTLKAGEPGEDAFYLPEDSDDNINSQSNQEVNNPPIDPAQYGMTLSVDGDRVDIGTVVVSATEGIDSGMNIAPGETDMEADELSDAITPLDEVASDDVAVMDLELNGFYGFISDADAADLAEDGVTHTESGVYVTVEEENPGLNMDPVEYDVGDAELVTDDDDRTAYLAFAPEDVADLDEDDEVNVTFHVTDDNPYVADDDEIVVSEEFSVVESTVEFDTNDDGEVIVDEEDGVVTGSTTLAPGTEFVVGAESSGDSPFLKTAVVEVASDQSWSGEFNFADVDAPTDFTVEITDHTDRVDAQLVDSSPTYALAVTVEDEAGEELDADVFVDGNSDWGELESGEYVVEAGLDGYEPVEETVVIDDEDVDLTLTLEEEQDEGPYELVVDVEDTDGEPIEDATVEVDGDTDWGELEPGTYDVTADADGYEATQEPVDIVDEDVSVTLTLDAEEDEDSSSDNGSSDETPDDGDDDSQPGFGVIVGIVALLGATLLAARSRFEN